MTCPHVTRERSFARSGFLLAGLAIGGLSAFAGSALAQDQSKNPVSQAPAGVQVESARPSAPENAGPAYSIEDLSYLLAPIALYPDPLLALVLSASTFPVQVVEADRWITANPDAVARRDFRQVDAMSWDSSVQALVRFPDEIRMLAEHLDWSQSLGMAFALQPADVSAAVQMLRAKAEGVGNLKSTPEQTVTAREEGGLRIIYIAPTNPERIYVPQYDTSTVFDTLLPGALVFATGVIVGSAWNNRWGWNNRTWNQVWISPPVWNPPPPNWNPRPPGVRPPGAWRPDRPGVRPDRPNLRPDRPIVRPPDRPNLGPGATRPDRPGVVRPDRPNVRPDRPNVRPDRPSAGRPPGASVRPDSQRPQARPRPGARPQQPVSRPAPQRVRPQARPQQPPRARPAQQRVRPQARPPQQQRARPQQRPSRNR
jgi:hypothetical protein